MRELKYASVRYCPQLGHNVVMEGITAKDGGFRLECLNKEDCGFSEEGCRNLLLPHGAAKKGAAIEAG